MAPVYITIDPEATGRNIRVLMTQNGYDIDDVREACGNVSAQAVYKWLSGKSLPSIDNLKILSVIFGTTMEGILVTDLPVVARGRLDKQEFGFDAPEGLEASLVMGFHRLLDAIVDLIKDCHSHYLLFLCFS